MYGQNHHTTEDNNKLATINQRLGKHPYFLFVLDEYICVSLEMWDQILYSALCLDHGILLSKLLLLHLEFNVCQTTLTY